MLIAYTITDDDVSWAICAQKYLAVFEGMVRLHRLGYQSAAQLLATESCG